MCTHNKRRKINNKYPNTDKKFINFQLIQQNRLIFVHTGDLSGQKNIGVMCHAQEKKITLFFFDLCTNVSILAEGQTANGGMP